MIKQFFKSALKRQDLILGICIGILGGLLLGRFGYGS